MRALTSPLAFWVPAWVWVRCFRGRPSRPLSLADRRSRLESRRAETAGPRAARLSWAAEPLPPLGVLAPSVPPGQRALAPSVPPGQRALAPLVPPGQRVLAPSVPPGQRALAPSVPPGQRALAPSVPPGQLSLIHISEPTRLGMI